MWIANNWGRNKGRDRDPYSTDLPTCTVVTTGAAFHGDIWLSFIPLRNISFGLDNPHNLSMVMFTLSKMLSLTSMIFSML